MGLFARRNIAEHKTICPLGGETCTAGRSSRSAYVIQVAPNTYIDLNGLNAGYAAYVNDPLNPLLENAAIKYDPPKENILFSSN
jgi:hypothetical protein